jgi:hypothetical protein
VRDNLAHDLDGTPFWDFSTTGNLFVSLHYSVRHDIAIIKDLSRIAFFNVHSQLDTLPLCT